jgi:hypothetical protein
VTNRIITADSSPEGTVERRINEQYGGQATILDVIAVLRDLGWTPPADPSSETRLLDRSSDMLVTFIRNMRAQADWHRDWGRPQPALAIDNALENVMLVLSITEGDLGMT